MDINALNDAWVAAGHKVSDLNAKISLAAVDDSITEDQIKDMKKELDTAKAKRDILKDQVAEARAAEVAKMDNKKQKSLTPAEDDQKKKFVNDFKGMVMGDRKVLDVVTSSTDESGNQIGLTIPPDIQTAIHTLIRQYDSLEPLVAVEKVNTPNGSRVIEKWTDVTPLADLDDETATISDNDDPRLTIVKYLIHRYAGITTITNTLLKDTADNIIAWLSSWIAKKVVVTRNQKILEKLQALTNKRELTKFDDIKDLTTTGVDPALQPMSSFITNVSAIAALSKVKDAMGRYLLQRDPTKADVWNLDGKEIHIIADRWLPTEADGELPLYYGDYNEAIKLFDRENMSLLTTNIGGGAFEKDETKIRVIDRFDVELFDGDAAVHATFKSIADQQANFPKA